MLTNTNKGEKGAVLMVTLLILIVLTLLGTAGVKTTTLEEKMSGNYRDNNLAFQAAEAGLREAENFLDLKVNAVDGDYTDYGTATSGLYKFVLGSSQARWDYITDNNLWDDASTTIEYGTSFGGLTSSALPVPLAKQPRYIIEETETCSNGDGSLSVGIVPTYPCYYRVTSRGVGGTNTSTVMLQSVYKRY